MVEAVAAKPDAVEARLGDIYGLAFGGRFGEHGYAVGEQMAAEIEHSFGSRTIPCLVAAPAEQYVLAYQAALDDGKNLKDSHSFAADTLAAARQLAGGAQPSCIAPR